MNAPILTLEVLREHDVVLAHQRARQIAGLLGFDPPEQTRIATAVSEIARNAVQHAGGGRAEFLVVVEPPQKLVIRVRDRGPGIADPRALLDGGGPAPRGMGLLGARRLMDLLEIEPGPEGGSVVRMAKVLPKRAGRVSPEVLARIGGELAPQTPESLFGELRQQNQELLRTLEELRIRQAEMAQLGRELEETNRGVVALYAELDEKANSLKRASELKSRFLSNISHEFRSPLNSIQSLCRILLDRTDGDLSAEQEKQVGYIRKASEGLAILVNDLLDLAKVEAGKVVIRPEEFDVVDLFGTLRGMIRPLLAPEAVTLVFEETAGLPPLRTDEGKVAQILRNFLSNAVKFTDRGEIRVTAALGPDDRVTFAVADTGMGIAPQDQERIFEEFAQVEGPVQTKVRGTGLGLPLSRKLAELLGGRVTVRSEPGVGSTFFAVLPRVYRDPGVAAPEGGRRADPSPALPPALIIDDDEVARYLLKGLLAELRLMAGEAEGGSEGLRRAGAERPRVIFLDLLMPDMTGFEVLRRLKSDPATREIPVVIHSSKTLSVEERGRLASAAVILDKEDVPREAALARLRDVLAQAGLAPEEEPRHG
jgi:signal transduction histidine kinase/CheY-like chemotaxis protein